MEQGLKEISDMNCIKLIKEQALKKAKEDLTHHYESVAIVIQISDDENTIYHPAFKIYSSESLCTIQDIRRLLKWFGYSSDLDDSYKCFIVNIDNYEDMLNDVNLALLYLNDDDFLLLHYTYELAMQLSNDISLM